MDFSNSNKNGSVRTTPAGINSLKEIKMLSLSKLIGKLKLTSAKECLENQDYINLIFEIDQEYTNIQSKNADLEKRLEESITSVNGATDKENNDEQVSDGTNDQSDKTQEVKDEKQEDSEQQELQEEHRDTEPKQQPTKDQETQYIQQEELQEDSRTNNAEIPMENEMENGGQEGQEKMRTENIAEIRQLRNKLKEMKTIIDNMESKQATTEESKNTFEKKYEKLKSSYEIHLRQSGEKMQEYQYAIERLNCKIDNDQQEKQRYKENKIKLEEQVNDLKLRLSQVAGSKLTENNPSITDLSDPNRPQKIAEQFSELYDNEWTDALEMLQKSGKSERVAIDTLLNTLKVCFEYCQEQSEKQQRNIANALLPTQSHDLGIFTSEVAKSVKDLRKMTDLEDHWVTWLNQEFLKTEEYNSLVEERKEELFINFVNVCLKCGWLSNVQDPPVVLDFNLEQFSKFDSSYTKVYTKPGDFVDFVVWPCMLRNTCGALLSKGVVQCTKDGGPKTLPEVSSAVDLQTTGDTAELTEETAETKPKKGDADLESQQQEEENADSASDGMQGTGDADMVDQQGEGEESTVNAKEKIPEDDQQTDTSRNADNKDETQAEPKDATEITPSDKETKPCSSEGTTPSSSEETKLSGSEETKPSSSEETNPPSSEESKLFADKTGDQPDAPNTPRTATDTDNDACCTNNDSSNDNDTNPEVEPSNSTNTVVDDTAKTEHDTDKNGTVDEQKSSTDAKDNVNTLDAKDKDCVDKATTIEAEIGSTKNANYNGVKGTETVTPLADTDKKVEELKENNNENKTDVNVN